MSGPTKRVRDLVWDRDGGACAWCGGGVSPGWHSLQHRRARGMGGTRRRDANSAVNLVLVHGSGTTGCHGWIEAHPREAERRGFRLRQFADPEVVPVLYAGGVWVRLGASGGWSAVSDLRRTGGGEGVAKL